MGVNGQRLGQGRLKLGQPSLGVFEVWWAWWGWADGWTGGTSKVFSNCNGSMGWNGVGLSLSFLGAHLLTEFCWAWWGWADGWFDLSGLFQL